MEIAVGYVSCVELTPDCASPKHTTAYMKSQCTEGVDINFVFDITILSSNLYQFREQLITRVEGNCASEKQ